MLQQQPSFIQNIVIQPKLGLLCISLESLVGFYEKEKQKESESSRFPLQTEAFCDGRRSQESSPRAKLNGPLSDRHLQSQASCS
ncbi:hypothetical protein D4764_05G0008460 [Takifugu flavidus]|uniref:Uncharacterized protein n=1 Tax=Takifugu flavidus TaxID=433684 RepID=A0A5C6N0F2_9TELE|nr:hypothetical protein D4764_05G0008460 [Takifugu flavidus]